ncbi:hypothetical protein ACTXT7_007934 [Hymenolepis weldensis]
MTRIESDVNTIEFFVEAWLRDFAEESGELAIHRLLRECNPEIGLLALLKSALKRSNYYPLCTGHQYTQYVQGSGPIPTSTLSIT